MTITAAIQFVQGLNTDAPGNAVFGDMSSGAVVCSAVCTGSPDTFVWKLIDKPDASALTLGQFSAASTGSFPQPDVRGGYLVELTASKGSDSGTFRLAFQVKESSGRWIPPFLASDAALTFGGSKRGWSECMEQWLHYLDTLSGGSPVVASVAALASLPAGALVSGTAATVRGFDGFILDLSPPSGSTPDGVNVVSASGTSGGMWMRLFWTPARSQFFDVINVNQSTGNDASTDPHFGTPLKSLNEAAVRIRRLGLITQNITINYAATTSTESFDLDLSGVVAAGSQITITVVGATTDVASQTISGYAAPNPATNTRGIVTFPAAGYANDEMLRWDSNSVAWVLGLSSSNVNFTGHFYALNGTIDDPGVGNSVTRTTLNSKIGNFSARLPPGFQVIVQNVEILGTQVTHAESLFSVVFSQCKITAGRDGSGFAAYVNCLVNGFKTGGGNPTKSPDDACFQCCQWNGSLNIVGCKNVTFAGSNVCRGATLAITNSVVRCESVVGLEDLGFFGLGSTSQAVSLTNGSLDLDFATFWGSNTGGVNETFLFNPGGWVFYTSTSLPTATGPTSAWATIDGRKGTFAQLPVVFSDLPGGFVRKDAASGASGAGVDLTAQINNIAATNLFTTNPKASMYEVYGYIELITAGTNGPINLNATWTDRTGTVQTKVIATYASIAAPGAGVGGVLPIATNGSTQVTYSVTGIVTPGALSYNIRVGVRPR